MMRIVKVSLIQWGALASISHSELVPGEANVKVLAVDSQTRCLVVTLQTPLTDGTTTLSTPLERVREIRWAPDEVSKPVDGGLVARGLQLPQVKSNQGPRR